MTLRELPPPALAVLMPVAPALTVIFGRRRVNANPGRRPVDPDPGARRRDGDAGAGMVRPPGSADS
jgi:hypothetical protein